MQSKQAILTRRQNCKIFVSSRLRRQEVAAALDLKYTGFAVIFRLVSNEHEALVLSDYSLGGLVCHNPAIYPCGADAGQRKCEGKHEVLHRLRLYYTAVPAGHAAAQRCKWCGAGAAG